MYLSAWVLLVVISIGISLGAFFWGVRTGQFSDPERARYLPLNNEFLPPPVKDPSKRTIEVYALILIGFMGVAVLLGTLVLSLYRSRG
jgi:cbb3-type cytochrome oxidase maturation protein